MTGDEPVWDMIDDVQASAAELAQAGQDLVDERAQSAGEVAADIPLEVAPLPFIAPNLMHGCSVARRKGDG